MPDAHYELPKLANIYDLDSGWSADREFYLNLAGKTSIDILDLGCGTGLICDAYAARGHRVTGVDPAGAMLDVARNKPHGKENTWVKAFAQDFKSDQRFDLIIMTGHAFQVLLDDADILATFQVMRDHLEPDGKIVFESRNPNIDWANVWGARKPYKLDNSDILATWRLIDQNGDRMTFEWDYCFSDETLTSRSVLRFASCAQIQKLLVKANLKTEKIFGDWDQSAFNDKTSREMIFTVTYQP